MESKFQFVAVLAFVAVVRAGVIVPPAIVVKTLAPIVAAAPVLKTVVAPVAVAEPISTKSKEAYDPHPQYKYAYDVHDSLSGDSKSAVEERDGDVVRGEYSLIDADGYRRIVQYTADPINGFNAVVRRVPLEPVQTVVKVAPTIVKAFAPVASTVYTAPIIKTDSPMAAPIAVAKVVPTVMKTVAGPSAIIKKDAILQAAAVATVAAPFIN